MPLRLPRSLRGRVLASTLVLIAVGLIVAGSATYGFLNAFLVRRVDQQLWSAVFPVADALNETDRFDPDGHGPPRGGFLVPPGTYGLLLDADGRMIRAEPFGFEEQQAAVPDLPSGLPGSTSAPDAEPRLLTVSTSEGSSIRYRAIAAPLAEGGTLVVAIPMIEVTDTLRRLLTVEIAVSVAVVAVIGGMALWLVRIGLRPLQRMGETAGAIAAGDLSRRVTPAEPDTEVGRLGLALNSMLGQIEEAFAERTASEQRFRRVVADASHGLRTPLTSIRGYAELFRRGASGRPEDLSKSMERIEAEAARMGVLVEDLFAPRPAGPGTATGSRPGRSDDPGRSGGPGCPGRRPGPADRASGARTGDRRRRRGPIEAGAGQPAGERPATHPSGNRGERHRRLRRRGDRRRGGRGSGHPNDRRSPDSSASTGWTRHGLGRRAGPAWDWRSPRRSRMHTVEAWPSYPATGAPGFA